MSFMTNFRSFFNVVGVALVFCFFLTFGASGDEITLGVNHDPNYRLPEGYCFEGIITEISPSDGVVSHELGTDSQLALVRDTPGRYTFFAQSVVCEIGGDCSLEGDGSDIYEISPDSPPIDYVVAVNGADNDSGQDHDQAGATDTSGWEAADPEVPTVAPDQDHGGQVDGGAAADQEGHGDQVPVGGDSGPDSVGGCTEFLGCFSDSDWAELLEVPDAQISRWRDDGFDGAGQDVFGALLSAVLRLSYRVAALENDSVQDCDQAGASDTSGWEAADPEVPTVTPDQDHGDQVPVGGDSGPDSDGVAAWDVGVSVLKRPRLDIARKGGGAIAGHRHASPHNWKHRWRHR